MEIRSLLTGSRGTSLPFTDHCPPIAENENTFNEIFKEVINYGKKAGWKTIDFKGGIKYFKDVALPFDTSLTHNLNLLQKEEDVLSTFRNSTKRNIKKAIQKGVHVAIKNTLESVKEYFKLNCITRKSHGLPPQPFYFFKKIYEHIISQKKGVVALAIHQNKVVAGAVFFHFNNQAIFKFGASDLKNQHLRPNNLIMWEAIRWYCQNKYKTFNFGRTDTEHKGLLQFKKGWGVKEEILNYYKYHLIRDCFISRNYDIKPYCGFIKIIPLPILRLTGNIFYRHVG